MNRILAFFLAAVLLLTHIPVSAHAADVPPDIISDSAVLIDADTGQVIYSKQMDKQQFPASITKIITVALALENAELSDTITMSEEAVSSVGRSTSHIALTTDEVITVEHAVYAAMLMSANDACNGLAEHVSGTIPEFAALMTEKAAEWGAKNTNFNNANGLKDELHYTTAYDMAMIMRHALSIDKFREIIGTHTYEMPPNNKQDEVRYFANQHSMLADPQFKYDGIIGGKAGYTTAAQYTLVTAAERDGITLIAVVMKSPKLNDKYYDTIALLDYGFENFSRVSIPNSELSETGCTVSDSSGNLETFDLEMRGEVSFLLHNSVNVGTVTRNILATKSFAEDYKIVLDLSLPASTMCMYPNIGTFEFSHSSSAVAAAELPAEDDSAASPSVLAAVLKIVEIIILIPIIGFILLILVLWLRKTIYRAIRRRRRRRQARRRRY